MIAEAADGGPNPCLSRAFRVADRQILRPSVAMMDQVAVVRTRMQLLLERIESDVALERARDEHPTIVRENTSMTNAVHAKPAHVATFGRHAVLEP